jgi:hypothetical protein
MSSGQQLGLELGRHKQRLIIDVTQIRRSSRASQARTYWFIQLTFLELFQANIWIHYQVLWTNYQRNID